MYRDDDWIEIVFLFESRPSKESLVKLFDVLSEQLKQQKTEETLSIAFWNETSDIERSNVSAEEAAGICSDYRVSTATIPFEGFELTVGCEYGNGYLGSVPHLTIREQIHPFTADDETTVDSEIKQRRNRFADILAQAGEAVDPVWGFGRRGGVASESKSPSDLLTTDLPPLYEYNLFSSEVVDMIGHNTVTDAPAWYINELSTGGVFLITREPPKSCSPHEKVCTKVAGHLGIEIADLF